MKKITTAPLTASTPFDQLEAWLEEERALREIMKRGPGAGVVTPEQAMRGTGLDLMLGMLRGDFPYPPFGQTLDFLPMEASAGRTVFQGTPGSAHFNPMGGVHGGWYATLLDSAMGCAVHTMMPQGRAYTTAELSINLVRAIGTNVRRVRAEGKVIHCGRQLATTEGRLYGPDGTLYAHGTSTCLVFEMKVPSPP